MWRRRKKSSIVTPAAAAAAEAAAPFSPAVTAAPKASFLGSKVVDAGEEQVTFLL